MELELSDPELFGVELSEAVDDFSAPVLAGTGVVVEDFPLLSLM